MSETKKQLCFFSARCSSTRLAWGQAEALRGIALSVLAPRRWEGKPEDCAYNEIELEALRLNEFLDALVKGNDVLLKGNRLFFGLFKVSLLTLRDLLQLEQVVLVLGGRSQGVVLALLLQLWLLRQSPAI